MPVVQIADPLYQLRIELLGTRPAVWRRVLVPGDYHPGELHSVIQLSMGWQECHLHSFVVRDVTYSREVFEMEDDPPDESAITVAEAFPRRKGRIEYMYDLGRVGTMRSTAKAVEDELTRQVLIEEQTLH